MHKKLAVAALALVLGANLNPACAAAPGATNALVELAKSQAERKQYKEAESSYRKALSGDPLNTDALKGLLALYRQQDQPAKLQMAIAQLTPAQREALGPALKPIEIAMLQDLAEQRIAKGQNDQAIKFLEQAVQIEPGDPWLHYKLAQQYAARGSIAMGTKLLETFLSGHPGNPDALYALALYQSGQGDDHNALDNLRRIDPARRTADMTALQQKLTIATLRKDSKALMQAGRKKDAVKMLSDAETLSSGNGELMLEVAFAWAEIGETQRGNALFEQTRTAAPSAAWRLRHASFLALTGDEQELAVELDAIAGTPKLSPAEANALAGLQEEATIRRAGKHTAAGDTALAHQALAPLLKANPDRAPLLFADARIYRAERDWQAALDSYARLLKLDPLDREARSGLVETLDASGKRTEAMQQMETWSAEHSAANNVQTGLHLAALYEYLGDYNRALQRIDALLELHPDKSYLLYDAWKMTQRAGLTDREIVYLKKLVAAEPSAYRSEARKGLPPQPEEDIGIDEFGSERRIRRDWKENRVARLIDRRSRWFSSAMDLRSRTGTAGLSEIHSAEIPLEYRTPWHANDEVFLRADLVRLDAGTVDATSSSFGGMLLCQPNCTAAPLEQIAQGASFNAGYEHGDFRADLGVTPVNFPVANIVGGLQYKGDLGPFGYSLEASRRPVTASLLSFAGAKDPYTGKTWGGVVASGARLGLSLDKGGTFGFWSSLGLHSLTGRNVQTNRRLQLMAGEQLRIVNQENRKLVLGLTGMYWDFSENAGEYTFGHGGYYSPDLYRSLSLPLTYTARTPRFSWMLRAAVSTSWSQTAAADYYPTDSTLQAQALALPATATHSGSAPSKGKGHSLKAAWEYQAAPQLFLGGVLALDRSESYAPNQALLYLRYSLDHAGAKPVFMPPEPVEPSSQFY